MKSAFLSVVLVGGLGIVGCAQTTHKAPGSTTVNAKPVTTQGGATSQTVIRTSTSSSAAKSNEETRSPAEQTGGMVKTKHKHKFTTSRYSKQMTSK